MKKLHRKLVSKTNLSKNPSQRSTQPLKNEAISKVLEQMEAEELRVVKPAPSNRMAVAWKSKPKSTQEMAIEELTQLHDLYFGRYKQKEVPNEAGQAARERRVEERPMQPQRKPKYEVQPPQIISKHQPNNSVNMP